MDLEYAISMEMVGHPEDSRQFQLPGTPDVYRSGFLPDTGTGVAYTLYGTILDAASAPLELVVVSAYDTLSDQLVGTDFTNSAGEYSIFDIPEGTEIRVEPTLTGWLFDPAVPVLLMDGDKTQDFTASEDPSFSSVCGQITGETFENVIVGVYSSDGSELLASDTSDANGDYCVWPVPSGIEVQVVPSKDGYHFDPPSATFVMDGDKLQDFAAYAGPLTVILEGTITDGVDPLSGVQVDVTETGTGDPINSSMTSPSGTYFFPIAQGAAVTVTPTLSGYEFAPPSANLIMDADKTQDFVGTPVAGTYSVYGAVTGPAGQDVLVEVHASGDGSLLGSDLTASDGSYLVSGIPPNIDVYVVPDKVGFTFDPSVANLFMDSDKEQNFVSSVAAYALWGTITDGVLPLDGVFVELVDADTSNPLGTDTTGATGVYLFEGIAGGTNVKVTPDKTGYEFDPSSATLLMDEDKTQDFTGSPLSNTDWVHTRGGADAEYVWRVADDLDGNQYIAGQIFTGEGGIHGFVEKRNQYGQFQWYREFEPPTGYTSVLILDMAVNPANGEVITAGYTIAADSQAWVMRLDTDGTVLQSRIGPAGLTSLANQIARDTSPGDYYVVGQGTDRDGTSADVLVMMFDGATNNLEWAELVEGSNGETPTACKLDGSGDLVVVGDYVNAAPTFTDNLVLKVKPDGTLKWGGVYDVNNGTTYTEGVVIGPDDEVYVLGSRNTSGIIVRIDDLTTSGSLNWARLWANEGSTGPTQFFDGYYNTLDSTIVVCGSTGDETQSKTNGLIVEFNSTATSTVNDLVWRNSIVDASAKFTAIRLLSGFNLAVGGDSLNATGSWGTATSNINPSPPKSTKVYDGTVEVLAATLNSFSPDVSSPDRTEDTGGGQSDVLNLRRSDLP